MAFKLVYYETSSSSQVLTMLMAPSRVDETTFDVTSIQFTVVGHGPYRCKGLCATQGLKTNNDSILLFQVTQPKQASTRDRPYKAAEAHPASLRSHLPQPHSAHQAVADLRALPLALSSSVPSWTPTARSLPWWSEERRSSGQV